MPSKKTILGVLLSLYSLVYFVGSFRLNLGTLDDPGCGVIPRIVGFLLVVFSGLHLYEIIRSRRTSGAKKAEVVSVDYVGPLGIMACVAVYPLLLSNLKFLVATFTIVFFMLLALRFGSILKSFFTAVGVTFGTFLVFAKVLGVMFPSAAAEYYLYSLF